MPKPKPSVGSEIAHARFKKGWSLDQLASAAGVSVKTIFSVEKGEVVPWGHTVYKLAAALDLDPKALFTDEVAS